MRSCEYQILTIRANMRILANSANTSGAIWKMLFGVIIHSLHCIFRYNWIILACKTQDMLLIRVIFEIIDDFYCQERIHAQARLLQRPKKGLFRGANTCEYLKIGIWYSPNTANTK